MIKFCATIVDADLMVAPLLAVATTYTVAAASPVPLIARLDNPNKLKVLSAIGYVIVTNTNVSLMKDLLRVLTISDPGPDYYSNKNYVPPKVRRYESRVKHHKLMQCTLAAVQNCRKKTLISFYLSLNLISIFDCDEPSFRGFTNIYWKTTLKVFFFFLFYRLRTNK